MEKKVQYRGYNHAPERAAEKAKQLLINIQKLVNSEKLIQIDEPTITRLIKDHPEKFLGITSTHTVVGYFGNIDNLREKLGFPRLNRSGKPIVKGFL